MQAGLVRDQAALDAKDRERARVAWADPLLLVQTVIVFVQVVNIN
jgi:hypothetical protein